MDSGQWAVVRRLSFLIMVISVANIVRAVCYNRAASIYLCNHLKNPFMSHLQLTCLGDFAITLAGEPLVAFQTDKMRALLIYLVLEGQPHQRSVLAQVLWPGYSDESARHSLRQSLHQLRLLLRDGDGDGDGERERVPWLLTTRQTVQFNPAAAVALDVTRFAQLLAETRAHPHPQLTTCQPCLAQLREAVTLYQGDFLAGFTVADSDPFEEWRRVIQEQLHLQVLHTLTQLADAAEAGGDAEAALQAARHQLALEPWLEAAHRRIMRIFAGRGQRAAALAQYQRCRQVLSEELGAEPEAETTALAEEIQRGAFDRMTKWQDDKMKKPDHPVILSSCHLLTPAQPAGRPDPLCGADTGAGGACQSLAGGAPTHIGGAGGHGQNPSGAGSRPPATAHLSRWRLVCLLGCAYQPRRAGRRVWV